MTNWLNRLGSAVALCLTGFLFACSEAKPGVSSTTVAAKMVAASGDVMRVHYIDVDQGNAALVEFKCAAILIDAGSEMKGQVSAKLMNYLDNFFARRPDLNRTFAAVYITHTHTDHNASLRAVVEQFTVSNYIHNVGMGT